MSEHTADPATEAFVAHRNLLFTVAYEILGSAADAEDVLQETWLRWVRGRPGSGTRPARLPGPDHHPPVAQPAAHHAAPQGVVRRPLAARAAAHRAGHGRGRRAGRERVDGDDARPRDAVADRARGLRAARGVRGRLRRDRGGRRQEPGGRTPDRAPGPPSTSTPAGPARRSPPGETRAALEAFQRAVETSDLQGLLDVLAPDVVLVSDGGGIKQAALRPVVGADKVVRFVLGGLRKVGGRSPPNRPSINGSPALLFRLDGEIDGVAAMRIEDARVTGIYYVRNPEKLSRIESETPLTLR